MLKTNKTLFAILCIILIIALIIALPLAWYYWIRPLRVGEFSLGNYTHFLEKFPSDKVAGSITDAGDAKEKGIAILIDIYGEELIAKENPFVVSYDKNSDSWLISGSMSPIPLVLGGTAHIILNSTDGIVLAVWHEK